MADTIRDVLIRVSIENGSMKLGQLDTSSAVASVQKMKADLQKELGDIKINPLDAQGIQQSANQTLSSLEQIQAAMKATIAIGMPGYGQSVRDRADLVAQVAVAGARSQPGAEALTDADWQKMHGQFSRQAEKSIRETDSETAAGQRAEARSAAEESRRIKREEIEQAREEARERRATAAAAKEQQAAINQAVAGTIQLTKGIAQMAVATGTLNGDMVKSIVQIEAFSNMAMGAYAALGPIGVGIAAIGAGYMATLQIQERAMELSSAYWREQVRDAERVASLYATGVHRQYSENMALSQGMPGTAGSASAVFGMSSTQWRLQDVAEIDARNDLTPDQKEEMRRRIGVDSAADERLHASRGRQAEAQRRLDFLNTNKVDPAAAERRITEQYRQPRRILEQEQKEIEDLVNNRTSADTQRTFRTSAEGPNYEDYQPDPNRAEAGKATLSEQERLLNIKKEIAELTEKEEKEQKQIVEDVAAQNREKVELQQQIVREKAEQHQTIAKRHEDAVNSVRTQKEGIRAGAIAYGTSSEGDRLQEQELQKKHERIKAQLAAKEAGKNVDVEEYNLHEIGLGKQTGNIALETINRQAIEQAKKDGIQKYETNDTTLAEAQKRLDTTTNEMNEQGPRLRVSASSDQAEIEKSSKEIVENIKKIAGITNALDKMNKDIKDLADQVTSWKMINNRK